jgi:hypothetical protein
MHGRIGGVAREEERLPLEGERPEDRRAENHTGEELPQDRRLVTARREFPQQPGQADDQPEREQHDGQLLMRQRGQAIAPPSVRNSRPETEKPLRAQGFERIEWAIEDSNL